MVDVNPHVTALTTLLAATGRPVYVARAADGAKPPYIVLHPSRGLAQQTSLNPDDSFRFCRFMTFAIGTGWEEADAAATRTRDALSLAVPTVTGRTSSPILHDQELGIDRDESLPTPVYIARDMWTFSTTPA